MFLYVQQYHDGFDGGTYKRFWEERKLNPWADEDNKYDVIGVLTKDSSKIIKIENRPILL